jgi:hypothetical protein
VDKVESDVENDFIQDKILPAALARNAGTVRVPSSRCQAIHGRPMEK